MLPSLAQKITRAMRPWVRLLRTSQSPPPSDRQRGMPVGQPYSAVAMSRPKNTSVLLIQLLQPIPDRLRTAR